MASVMLYYYTSPYLYIFETFEGESFHKLRSLGATHEMLTFYRSVKVNFLPQSFPLYSIGSYIAYIKTL